MSAAGRPNAGGRQHYDSELEAIHARSGDVGLGTFLIEHLPTRRDLESSRDVDWSSVFPALLHRESTIDGPNGAVQLSIFRRADGGDKELLPAIYFIHGGGMMVGDRFTRIETVLDWVEAFNVICVSVEYRLAPEHPDPAPVEDCYAGLAWLCENADALGVDGDRIVVCGVSAGGGLAAGTALLARDRGGPPLLGQLLVCPMLDDRNNSPSALQFAENSFWDRRSNDTAWEALLGSRAGGDLVSAYAAPSRAVDLASLPATYLDVGSVELFRDEDVDYAGRLMVAGNSVELHVWQGGFHEFDAICPTAAISMAAIATRTAWVHRLLSRAGCSPKDQMHPDRES